MLFVPEVLLSFAAITADLLFDTEDLPAPGEILIRLILETTITNGHIPPKSKLPHQLPHSDRLGVGGMSIFRRKVPYKTITPHIWGLFQVTDQGLEP